MGHAISIKVIPAKAHLVLVALALVGLCEPRTARAEAAAEKLGRAWSLYEGGNYQEAEKLAASISPSRLRNDDYRLYVLAQSRALRGDCKRALPSFRALAKASGSRFRRVAAWRVADCLWQLGKIRDAKKSYERLLKAAGKQRKPGGDTSLAKFRIAAARARLGQKSVAIRELRRFFIEHPLHPMAGEAMQLTVKLGGRLGISAEERLRRAKGLTAAKKWHESIAELERIGDDITPSLKRRRDYWIGMTLFKMRRQYARAGKILLGIYKDMGSNAAKALFHGARALSRADKDKEAIVYYQRVVAEYPRSRWAAEAQYLSGWLEFNMGNYAEGIPYLERMLKLYPRSRYATRARWFLGMSHFLLGNYETALPAFEKLAKRKGKLSGGKGRYWHARALQKLGRKQEASGGYRTLVGRYPFSWYALLGRARLEELGAKVGPFGSKPRSSSSAPAIAGRIPPAVASDPLIRDTDELIAAGLGVFAAWELRRNERTLLKRHGREKGLAALMESYRRAGNFNRPWMLAVVYGGSSALNAPPKGRARIWWEHAYPRAYSELTEKHRGLGKNPRYWLESIMRKESGFNPHVHSYADARGLLQMIPATTKRVVAKLGMTYTSDLLFDPEANIKTGSWYIGKLFRKFRQQPPMAAGSFNSGPKPVMRWFDKYKGRPTDEWVELVSYTPTREYMKKVTETYARYQYLYEGDVYEQSLVVNSDYLDDSLTY